MRKEVQQLTRTWIPSKGDFCDGKNSSWDKTDQSWISKRQKLWYFHITDLFTRLREIANCKWAKQSHLEKSSSGKLRTSTLVNNGTLRSTTNFPSALTNVSDVKMSDLFAFLVMQFSYLCSNLKMISGGRVNF